MKRVISVFIITAILMSFVTVVTAAPVENLSGYKSVVVKGDTSYDSGTIVSVMAEDKTSEDIVHAGMTECKIDGSFFYKFTCDNPENLSVRVKKGDEPVENYSVTTLTDTVPCDVSLSLLNDAGKIAHVPYDKGPYTIKAEVFNIYAEEDKYNMILAAYSKNGLLLQASPVEKTLKYDKNGEKYSEECKIELSTEASESVYEVKAFAWTKETIMPLASSICSNEDNSSGLANLNDQAGTLKVAFLGGSITAGTGASETGNRYSSQLIENYFKSKYPHKTVEEINAGIGATGSQQGAIRLEKDILSKEPDVVFIEFAVNDQCGVNETTLREQRLSYYEDIITRLANAPKQPVIIMLYSASFRDDYPYAEYNGVGGNKPAIRDNAGKYQQELADYYGIGSVDFDGYLKDGFANNKSEFESWYKYYCEDAIHPNDTGHATYANYIKKCLEDAPDNYFKHTDTNKTRLRETLLGSPELVLHNDSRIKYDGFTETWHETLNRFYPNKYRQSTTGKKSSFTFEFTGKVFGIYGVRPNWSLASFDYDIDNGVRTGHVDRDTTGTYMPVLPFFLITDLPEGSHTITLTVNGDEISQYNEDGTPASYKGGMQFGWLIVDEKAE